MFMHSKRKFLNFTGHLLFKSTALYYTTHIYSAVDGSLVAGAKFTPTPGGGPTWDCSPQSCHLHGQSCVRSEGHIACRGHHGGASVCNCVMGL